jgi:hypothetical protein
MVTNTVFWCQREWTANRVRRLVKRYFHSLLFLALTLFHWYNKVRSWIFTCWEKIQLFDTKHVPGFLHVGKKSNFLILKTQSTISEYDVTKNIFANSYPWLFPGGSGDMYDMTRGKYQLKIGGITFCDTMMVGSYKTLYLDSSYTIQCRDIRAIVRATSSYHRIDLSEGTHQLLRIYKGR